jgi:hypothetical protein
MIGPLYAIPSFFIFDVVMRNLYKKKRNKICKKIVLKGKGLAKKR